jgi:curved DNA-binding protein CbpA
VTVSEVTVEDLDPEAACYYDRLGIDPRAEDPKREVMRAYQLAKQDDDMSPQAVDRVQKAWRILKDDQDREQYDAFLERFGRNAGTEAYHTWDDQGRPAPPAEWTPPGQSSNAGPRQGRTPETDTDDGDEEGTERRTDRGRGDRDTGDGDTSDRDTSDRDTSRTPNQRRRERRQRARQRERQSSTTDGDTGRDRQTTRDSGARTSERQSSDGRAEQENGRQRSRQRQSAPADRGDTSDAAAAAIEAATATKYRVGYLLCALGTLATLGLSVAYTLDVATAQNEVGPVGLLFLLTGGALAYVTSGWTDAVGDTSTPSVVYDAVPLGPRLVKWAALVGAGLAVLQSLLQSAAPEPVLILLGVVSLIGIVLFPLAFSLTQVYAVTLGRLAV